MCSLVCAELLHTFVLLMLAMASVGVDRLFLPFLFNMLVWRMFGFGHVQSI